MKFKKIFMVVLGTFLCAISFTYFLVPNNITMGGVSGISQVIHEYYLVNKSLFVFIASIILLIFSVIFLDKQRTLNSILGSILFPFFMYLTELCYIRLHVQIDNVLLSALFGGIFFGIGQGIVYRENYTTGGTDIISQIISEYLHMSRGMSIIIVESFILLLIGVTFGFSNLMYSIIVVIVSSMIIDKVLLGISNNKSFYIITKYPEKVKKYIMEDLKHGVTILDGTGAFSKKHQDVLLTVIPTREYYKLKQGLKLIDAEAFFVVNDAYEVGGGK